MSLTPVEIRHVKLKRRPFGYARGETDALLHDIIESFEDVWRARADLDDQLERVEAELDRSRELEALLRKTLLSAERAADDLQTRTRREAELIIDEARAKARRITAGAEDERASLQGEIRHLRRLERETRAGCRAFLLEALERLEAATEESQVPGQAA